VSAHAAPDPEPDLRKAGDGVAATRSDRASEKAPTGAGTGTGTGPRTGPRTGTRAGAEPNGERPVVLITGASSGIGAAVAARFAADAGWRILLQGGDEKRLGQVAALTGGAAVSADFTDPADAERLSRAAMDAVGRVDVLVAAAGIGWAGPFITMPQSAIRQVLAVDLEAVVRLSRLVVPQMVDRGAGSVVLVGSIAGAVGVRDEAVVLRGQGGAGCLRRKPSLRAEGDGRGRLPGRARNRGHSVLRTAGTPCRRSRVRPVPTARVAEAVWRAVVRRHRAEIYVPR
jgi:hypothetical protein